ncbi:AraC family transcriptional regulator [Algoriphagus sp. AK58]|uniref:AraC family transcriptional regulator n=1 Tax=Algoriphagus sp. AK58 TaxID=1406877 RepID=UPI00164F3CE5|nr:AraC family transcriptional regulator [Algoriphagus sp. AK58]MBC6367666.1 AraC family transcriptional regulator [Algoriphagus sp. AK58]
MKAVFEYIHSKPNTSFIYKYLKLPSFDAPYHFHPEFELTWIEKGEGMRYVGRNAQPFLAGDLVFLGSNLPHCWINRPHEELVAAHVIQFHGDFLGKDFFNLPEMESVRKLFTKSHSGLMVTNTTKHLVGERILRLPNQTPLQQITGIVEILGILSQSQDLVPLDHSFEKIIVDLPHTERFNRIISFLIQNFKKEIRLNQMAEIAHLSPAAFCRYFKGVMQKTLMEVVLEFRIQHACQLLASSDYPISQVALESGFEDLPYFNRKFKKMVGVNPMAYRRKSKLEKYPPNPSSSHI